MLRIVLAVVAVLLSGFAVWRRVSPPASQSADQPVFVTDWENAIPLALPERAPLAPHTMLVLADVECPACASYRSVVERVSERLPGQVRVLHVDYPLRQHRFALMAARAAECADSVGRFHEFESTLYRLQDSIGILTWTDLAARAGIADSVRIEGCARGLLNSPRLEAARRFSESVAPRGTPTVILDGWRFPYPPSVDEIEAFIQSIRVINADSAS
jgi:protein-disulfide isomerase